MLSIVTRKSSLVVRNVQLQIVRYKRVNLRKPRPPHFQAQKVEKALQAFVPKPYDINFPEFLRCRKPLQDLVHANKTENPYERILANELISLFENSKMILFLHRNPLSGEEFYGARFHVGWFKEQYREKNFLQVKKVCAAKVFQEMFKVLSSVKMFKKANMELLRRSRTTVRMAVENTQYFHVMKIFHSHTLILCSALFNLDSVFKILKKMPYYVLLGGIIENQFLHKNKLEEYGRLSNLDAARGHFIRILCNIGGEMNNTIIYQQNSLISSLRDYQKL